MGSERVPPLKEKLGLLGPTFPSPSLSKVPNKLRSVKKEAYSPQMVSIGPYHHGNSDLLGMEEHKNEYMLTLLRRTNDPEKTFDDCGKAIKNLDQRVRRCYADKIRFDATKLGQILLVDGCFVLELFYNHVILQRQRNLNTIAHNVWMVPTLRHDLVLLENQIPFFIIVELYNIFNQHLNILAEYSPTSLALSFFYPEEQNVSHRRMSTEPNHLLDLLHQYFLPTLGNDSKGSPSGNDSSSSPHGNDSSGSPHRGFDLCASELLKAGIEFEKINNSHLLHVQFDNEDGVIKIPPFSIHERESLLRNLIALEQCGFSSTFHISSYAVVIRSLIRSPLDVELLQQKGIITYDLERGEDVLAFIDGICKNILIKHFYFRKLCSRVNAYRNSKWNWHKQKTLCRVHCQIYLEDLKRDYCSNPWKIIAFLAALALLILTGLQTLYAVRSYHTY